MNHASRFGSMRVDTFLDAMASRDATPGGGAAAALAGALGASLLSMVGRLTIGRAGFEDLAERMEALVERADAARAEFLALAERDAEAFEAVMRAFRLPKESEADRASRSSAIQVATERAAAVPLEIARRAVALMDLAEDATALGNPNAASDGLTGAAMLFAATVSARANVEINASSLREETTRQALLDEVAGLRSRADELLEQCREAFGLRLSS